jgi:DNA-binding CsgD family transcriptional regulator
MTEIEFFLSADQTELMFQQNGISKPLGEEDHEFINLLYQIIKDNYHEAFTALSSIYTNSAHFKFLMVRRFGKCNFGIYDNKPDLRSDLLFNLEFVPCPIRGECKWENTICMPKFNTNLSEREMEVLKLICENLEDLQIAERLFISVFTVNNHRRSIERKLCVNNKLGILKYAKENSLI